MSTSPISTQCNTSPAHDISLNPTAATNPHVSSPTALPVSPTPPTHTVNLQTHPHPMHTRSHDNIVQPKQFYPGIIRYPLPKALLTITNSTPPEPSCFTEASKSPEWRAAMATKFTALLKNSTWTLVPSKPNTNVMGCKWVFCIKRTTAGTIERYKARLVAKGFHQQHGVDYGDTFSPIIKPVTIRTVLSFVVASNWDIRQLDVTNAFLHGVLSEDVYMTQPPGFVHPSYPHHVCHLRKALYGLKQAPRAWYSRLSTRLLDLGFKAHKVDSSMYLSQRRYITDLLRKTNMHEAKPVSSPMASSIVLSQHTGTSLSDPSSYRSVVGSLQYLSLTRPDISFAVNKVCQFMANPTEDHWSAMIAAPPPATAYFLVAISSLGHLENKEPSLAQAPNLNIGLLRMLPHKLFGYALFYLNLDLYPLHLLSFGVTTLVQPSKALSIRFISSKDQLADTFTKPLPTAKFILLRDNLNVRELLLRLRGHIRTALPISVTDTDLKSTDKEEVHHQDIHKS
uniref:Reverse transcriptase Ty1/copia-type domain-containing protein n=1 Tax=Fagus sylvatica TaxID=28930 RepID=A0A2N9ELD8_FAGSY